MRRSRKLAPVVFDMTILADPMVRLAHARSSAAIFRAPGVLHEIREEAADRANRYAGKAGDALSGLAENTSLPSAVRSMAEKLLDEVSDILRESYDVLHPPHVKIAPVLVLLPKLSPGFKSTAANDVRAA